MTVSQVKEDVYLVGDPAKFADNKAKIIYCNGIESTPEMATQQQGLLISEAFDRPVTVVYNPTKVKDYTDEKVIGYFAQYSENQVALEEKVSDTLVEQIREQIAPNKPKVLVFAHSHGTPKFFIEH